MRDRSIRGHSPGARSSVHFDRPLGPSCPEGESQPHPPGLWAWSGRQMCGHTASFWLMDSWRRERGLKGISEAPPPDLAIPPPTPPPNPTPAAGCRLQAHGPHSPPFPSPPWAWFPLQTQQWELVSQGFPALRFMTWGEQSSGNCGLWRGHIRGQAPPTGLTCTNSLIFPGCPGCDDPALPPPASSSWAIVQAASLSACSWSP